MSLTKMLIPASALLLILSSQSFQRVLAASSAFPDGPLVLMEPRLYSCLHFVNNSGGLVCDIISRDIDKAIDRFQAVTGYVANVSLIIHRAGPQFEFPMERLLRLGPLESLFIRSLRRPFILANCSLQLLTDSLLTLDLRGVSHLGDLFCAPTSGLRTLKLQAAIISDEQSEQPNVCWSPMEILEQAKSSLVELEIRLPVDCNISNFKLDGMPLLESVQLRTFKESDVISGSGVNSSSGSIGSGSAIPKEEYLSEVRFANLPRLRTLGLMLNRKVVRCDDGVVFGPGAFENLTSLETVYIGGLFILPSAGIGPFDLLAPKSFRTGSSSIRKVTFSVGYLGDMIIDLSSNSDLLSCTNCPRQDLIISEPWFSYTTCRVTFPVNVALNVTHLRICRCRVGSLDSAAMNNWPRLRVLLLEQEEGFLEEGSATSGRKQLLVNRLNINDLLQYLVSNPNMEEATIYAAECVCSLNGSVTDRVPTARVTIGCRNLELDPFRSIKSLMRACHEFETFSAKISLFIGGFLGQCVQVKESEVSCVVRSNFNQAQPIPYRLTHFTCLLDTTVTLLTKHFLSSAENLKTLALSGAYYLRNRPEGLQAIEDGAFEVMQSLEILNLRNNKLLFITNSTFTGLSRLRYLDLSSNYFLTHMEVKALHPLSLSLQTLKLTVANASRLPTLQAESSLQRLESLSVEFTNAYERSATMDIPTGSFANLPTLRHLAIAFDENHSPRRAVLRRGSVANLPRLQNLAVALDTGDLSQLVIETDAFLNLSGDLRYVSLSCIQAPVAESNWIQLLAGSREPGVSQEVILEFRQAPLEDEDQQQQEQQEELQLLPLLDDLSPHQQFNITALTLGLDGGRQRLSGDDLSRLGRHFPSLLRLNLRSCLTLNFTSSAATPGDILSGLASASTKLTEVHAIPEVCDDRTTSQAGRVSRWTVGSPAMGGRRAPLTLTLACSGDEQICEPAGSTWKTGAAPGLLATSLAFMLLALRVLDAMTVASVAAS